MALQVIPLLPMSHHVNLSEKRKMNAMACATAKQKLLGNTIIGIIPAIGQSETSGQAETAVPLRPDPSRRGVSVGSHVSRGRAPVRSRRRHIAT